MLNLESNSLSRFDNLDKKMLNLKVVVIKDLQFKNQRLRNEIINLESHWKKTII